MYITKVLKRGDASSIIVAIVLAMTFVQSMFMPVSTWSYKISRIGGGADQGGFGSYPGNWRDTYIAPLLTILLTVVLLELFIRLFVWLHPRFVNKKR